MRFGAWVGIDQEQLRDLDWHIFLQKLPVFTFSTRVAIRLYET